MISETGESGSASRFRAGFTLIELLLVVALIGMGASLIVGVGLADVESSIPLDAKVELFVEASAGSALVVGSPGRFLIEENRFIFEMDDEFALGRQEIDLPEGRWQLEKLAQDPEEFTSESTDTVPVTESGLFEAFALSRPDSSLSEREALTFRPFPNWEPQN